MATQTVTQHSPVVQFPQSIPAKEISQADLISVIEARNVFAQLKAKVEELEDDIKARLDAGATVQVGVHIAELKSVSRRNVAWKDVVIRLATRLKMDGAAYCECVLAATKPTQTVSLVVK